MFSDFKITLGTLININELTLIHISPNELEELLLLFYRWVSYYACAHFSMATKFVTKAETSF